MPKFKVGDRVRFCGPEDRDLARRISASDIDMPHSYGSWITGLIRRVSRGTRNEPVNPPIYSVAASAVGGTRGGWYDENWLEPDEIAGSSNTDNIPEEVPEGGWQPGTKVLIRPDAHSIRVAGARGYSWVGAMEPFLGKVGEVVSFDESNQAYELRSEVEGMPEYHFYLGWIRGLTPNEKRSEAARQAARTRAERRESGEPRWNVGDRVQVRGRFRPRSVAGIGYTREMLANANREATITEIVRRFHNDRDYIFYRIDIDRGRVYAEGWLKNPPRRSRRSSNHEAIWNGLNYNQSRRLLDTFGIGTESEREAWSVLEYGSLPQAARGTFEGISLRRINNEIGFRFMTDGIDYEEDDDSEYQEFWDSLTGIQRKMILDRFEIGVQRDMMAGVRWRPHRSEDGSTSRGLSYQTRGDFMSRPLSMYERYAEEAFRVAPVEIAEDTDEIRKWVWNNSAPAKKKTLLSEFIMGDPATVESLSEANWRMATNMGQYGNILRKYPLEEFADKLLTRRLKTRFRQMMEQRAERIEQQLARIEEFAPVREFWNTAPHSEKIAFLSAILYHDAAQLATVTPFDVLSEDLREMVIAWHQTGHPALTEIDIESIYNSMKKAIKIAFLIGVRDEGDVEIPDRTIRRLGAGEWSDISEESRDFFREKYSTTGDLQELNENIATGIRLNREYGEQGRGIIPYDPEQARYLWENAHSEQRRSLLLGIAQHRNLTLDQERIETLMQNRDFTNIRQDVRDALADEVASTDDFIFFTEAGNGILRAEQEEAERQQQEQATRRASAVWEAMNPSQRFELMIANNIVGVDAPEDMFSGVAFHDVSDESRDILIRRFAVWEDFVELGHDRLEQARSRRGVAEPDAREHENLVRRAFEEMPVSDTTALIRGMLENPAVVVDDAARENLMDWASSTERERSFAEIADFYGGCYWTDASPQLRRAVLGTPTNSWGSVIVDGHALLAVETPDEYEEAGIEETPQTVETTPRSVWDGMDRQQRQEWLSENTEFHISVVRNLASNHWGTLSGIIKEKFTHYLEGGGGRSFRTGEANRRKRR